MNLVSKILSSILVLGGILFLCPYSSKAAIRERWELEFTHKPPRVFTYVDPLNNRTNHAYIIFSVTNPTTKNISLSLDFCIKTDKGRFYQDSIRPLVEGEIIVKEEKLGGLTLGLRKERIKELKQESKYLNCRELRDKAQIKPQETITGIAIFEEIDSRAKELDVMIGGLVDIVKQRYERDLEGILEDKLVYEYECKLLKTTYASHGDEFYSHGKEKIKIKKTWVIRNYGPIGTKDTVPILIQSLEDMNPLIREIAFLLLRRLTDQEFKYVPEKELGENKEAVLRWQEWWAVNKDRLVYDLSLNKFSIAEKEDTE
ncbi:hypothetical protein ACFL5I_00765 [Planctomycetota bacterium]